MNRPRAGGGIAQQIAGLEAGDHLCFLYAGADEQFAVVAPFIRDGLTRGERCFYIVDERTEAEVEAALAAAGVDVAAEVARGALVFATSRETYLRDGRFDPQPMIDLVREAKAAAVRDGFSALRATGEMTWALGPEPGNERLVEYEALLDTSIPGSRTLAICQYNRRRFPPRVILDILRTHPVVIAGDELCPNYYFEPHRFVLDAEADAERVEWMIEQLRRARETERARQEFLSVASHELKTPLTILRGIAQVTVRRFEREGPKEIDRLEAALRTIDTQSLRLARLVDQVLDVSRIDSGRLKLLREPGDLGTIMRKAVHRMHTDLPPAAVELHLPAAPMWVEADAFRLEQVIVNLLDNAVKYGAASTALPVVVALEEDGDAPGEHVRLTITDSGPGVPLDERPYLFDRFFHGHKPSHLPGMGLGLYTAREIVSRHGGSVTAEYPESGGTRIAVVLPRLSPQQYG